MTYNTKDLLAQIGLKSMGYDCGTPDGLWGAKSDMALNKWNKKTSTPTNISLSPKLDARSERNISTLLPIAQAAARKFMAAIIPAMAVYNFIPIITSGTRTYAEQNELHAQGRSKPGPIVTNATGGYSNHNFGIAWDITLFHNNVPVWDSPRYTECATIGEDQGLDCGAFWKSLTDEPHYNLQTGLSMSQMRERHDAGHAVI